MKIIKVNLKNRSYNIIVGDRIIRLLGKCLAKLKIGRDAYIITNRVVKNKFGRSLEKTLKENSFCFRLKTIPDTEKSKSLEMAAKVLKDLALYDKKKRTFIIALGGGVVGDLAGFIASIYKRGIPYIQVPTTLLAQVDSSIGGKTAIDLPEAKNLAGAFYQPRLVFSDTHLLKTLSQRQISSGLAEVVKYGIIKDKKLFYYLERNYPAILSLKPDSLMHIVEASSRVKAGIVRQDEREEKGLRTILNFGHTIGHAIEAAGNFKGYTHGEAISLGMLAALELSVSLKMIKQGLLLRIEGLLKKMGLPTQIKGVSLRRVIFSHYHDKKFIGSKNRFVLLEGLGKTRIVENISLDLIKAALRRRI